MTTDALPGRMLSCTDVRCNYREPHDHGLACGHECTVCAGRTPTHATGANGGPLNPSRPVWRLHAHAYVDPCTEACPAHRAPSPPARKATPDA